MIATAYKVLGPNRRAFHGGIGEWPEPGEWLRVEGPLIACRNGLHLCAREHLLVWLGPEIWAVEYEVGDSLTLGDKLVTRAARLVRKLETWNDRTARLFAADCAERALPFFEARYPNDARPRGAVMAARAFARGEIDAASMDAAMAAAWDAAGEAAGDAERAWQTERLFQYLEGRIDQQGEST